MRDDQSCVIFVVQITSVSFVNIIKCHNRSATVTTLTTGRTRVSRAANVLAGGQHHGIRIPYASRFVCIHIFYLYADTGCQETSPHSSRSTVILSQKLLLFSFVLAHSSRRPPSHRRGQIMYGNLLRSFQKLFFTSCGSLVA